MEGSTVSDRMLSFVMKLYQQICNKGLAVRAARRVILHRVSNVGRRDVWYSGEDSGSTIDESWCDSRQGKTYL